MENPGSTQQALANLRIYELPCIKWHMAKLIESGLVIAARDGKVIKYFIQDPRNLVSSIMNYMPVLWNTLVNRFARKFLETSLVKTKEINNKK